MYKRLLLLSCIILVNSSLLAQYFPLTERVNVQADTAQIHQVIDGCWVGVGTNVPHSIQRDTSCLFMGEPSYRFELRQNDNTLEGYNKGETKGRAELCYCFATCADFAKQSPETFGHAQIMKTVYHYGKGSCPQGSAMSYTFSIYVPSALSSEVSTIFAQWHGMPSRTLVADSTGKVMQLTTEQFLEIDKHMYFKKDIAYDKTTNQPNGWIIEQGGYPPLAFAFSNGYFIIKANSDRKWLTDKTDRCNANAAKAKVLVPVTSTYKASTIAYKMPFEDFPKDRWVTFQVHIIWTVYGKEAETILAPGCLDVTMAYPRGKKEVTKHIVNHQKILIGRNDDYGYYFKFGIYRVDSSTVPVCYNLAGYSEEEWK